MAKKASKKKAGGKRASKTPAPTRTQVVVVAPAPSSAAPIKRRSNVAFKSKRTKGGGKVSLSYSKVAGDSALQVGKSISEGLFALASAAADAAAEASETKADDAAVPYIKGAFSTGLRFAADTVLAKKYPGLSAVLSAGASAMAGDTYGQAWRRAGVKAVARTVAKAQEPARK